MLPLAEGPRPFTYPAKGWMRPCQLVFFPNACKWLSSIQFKGITGVATLSQQLPGDWRDEDRGLCRSGPVR